MTRRSEILVVDDEEVARESLAAWLREDGHTVQTAASGSEALEEVRDHEFAIHFIDLLMPGGLDGLGTMAGIRALRPDAAIVIITGYATVDTAVSAMKQGALDYLVKPCNPDEISLLVSRVLRVKKLERENVILRKKLSRRHSFHDLVSKNPRMHEIFRLVEDVSSLRSTVLIQGESGTGKELIARAIHEAGERSARPFVGVSCAALTETLLEAELFGHEKGAFTGALSQRKGKFEQADGGTIFLDEIGDMSPKLQMDLLRVLQERSFYRVGGLEEVQVDVRVIAATHRDLEQGVRAGAFREDLFYRLNVINIRVPPLRERREDIPLLARHFVERLAREMGKDTEDVGEGALKLLMDHEWPGNVRELENAIERAVVTGRGAVLGEEQFDFLSQAPGLKAGDTLPARLTLAELENRYITETLRRTGGNIKEAAARLGIDRSTLYDRIRKHRIVR